MRSLEINADSICILGDDCYYVQSATEPSCNYVVELSKLSCDCPDWPRIQLCKHVSAVAHFFGSGNLLDQLTEDPTPASVETAKPMESGGSPNARDTTATMILESVITVSREYLSDGVPSSPDTVRSLHVVEVHLTAVVWSSCSLKSPLPDKEQIPPNQHSWTETAQRMGVCQWKRPHAATVSSPEPPAAKQIGELNCKQPRLKNPDPYSGGVSSGRNAAPNAQSVTQNAQARTHAAAEPAFSQPCRCGRKCVDSVSLSLPLRPASESPLQLHLSSLAPSPGLANLLWYTAQPTALNTGAYPFATASVPGPSQHRGETLPHPPCHPQLTMCTLCPPLTPPEPMGILYTGPMATSLPPNLSTLSSSFCICYLVNISHFSMSPEILCDS